MRSGTTAGAAVPASKATRQHIRAFAALWIAILLTGCATREPDRRNWPAPLKVQLAGEGVQAKFFGVSTIALSDGTTTLMIDGFFSRPDPPRLLFALLSPDVDRIRAALWQGDIREVHLLLVAHSHFDHAMDVGVVARETGARLVASESTANVARGQDLEESRITVIKAEGIAEEGEFVVHAFPAEHAPIRPRIAGTIDAPLRPPASMFHFRRGEVYDFLVKHPRFGRILVVSSADPRSPLQRPVRADVVLLGIGGLGKGRDKQRVLDYWNNVVRASCARLVIPIHWDDFSKPAREPLAANPALFDDVDYSMVELRQLAHEDGIAIGLMPLYRPVHLLPQPAGPLSPSRAHCG